MRQNDVDSSLEKAELLEFLSVSGDGENGNNEMYLAVGVDGDSCNKEYDDCNGEFPYE